MAHEGTASVLAAGRDRVEVANQIFIPLTLDEI